jgi:hypothetical protein
MMTMKSLLPYALLAASSVSAFTTTAAFANPDTRSDAISSCGNGACKVNPWGWASTYLFPGQQIVSPSCNAVLQMQTDGNLVDYTYDYQGYRSALWASNTAGVSGAYAIMQADGNFVVFDANHNGRWQTGYSNNNHDIYSGEVLLNEWLNLDDAGMLVDKMHFTYTNPNYITCDVNHLNCRPTQFWNNRTIWVSNKTSLATGRLACDSASSTVVYFNTDFHGSDMTWASASSMEACAERCVGNGACKAFAFVANTCYQKNATFAGVTGADVRMDTNVISGEVTGR